jgi:hypothetical protein
MQKIVINSSYGGFGLSDEAWAEYCQRKNLIPKEFGEWNIPRNDPDLIDIVETMGEESFGKYASLKIVEIPDEVEWFIQEYDGREHVAEKHRTWY